MSIWEDSKPLMCSRCGGLLYNIHNNPHDIDQCVENLGGRVQDIESVLKSLRKFINDHLGRD